MRNRRVKDFYYSDNAIGGEPDYVLAENFVRTAEAFVQPQIHTKVCRLSQLNNINCNYINDYIFLQ